MKWNSFHYRKLEENITSIIRIVENVCMEYECTLCNLVDAFTEFYSETISIV